MGLAGGGHGAGEGAFWGDFVGKNPTDRGKLGVKRSLLVEGNGIPIGVAVEGANRNDFKMARETIEGIAVARPKPTEDKPQGMCLDKGYDYTEVRELVDEFGFTGHIRSRGEEAKLIKKAGTGSGVPNGLSRLNRRRQGDGYVP